MKKSAELSEDRVYRYSLTRTWDELYPAVMFIGLNPSTADEKTDDPTIRRCIRFAQDWGYGGLVMTNLFAYRATDPRELEKVGMKVAAGGVVHNAILFELADEAGLIVAAWGAWPVAKDRAHFVISKILAGYPICCLGLTKDGSPRHPLYVSANMLPLPFLES